MQTRFKVGDFITNGHTFGKIIDIRYNETMFYSIEWLAPWFVGEECDKTLKDFKLDKIRKVLYSKMEV